MIFLLACPLTHVPNAGPIALGPQLCAVPLKFKPAKEVRTRCSFASDFLDIFCGPQPPASKAAAYQQHKAVLLQQAGTIM
jgi:hypothetical protein